MKITVHLPGGESREFDLPDGSLVSDALVDAGQLVDACIVFVDDKPVPVDAPLEDGMRLKVHSVVSGG